MDYVVVFAKLVSNPDQILVVEKNKPEWQAGRYNLVGGKIEAGESPEQAAVRELEEEAGLKPVTKPQMMGAIFGSWGTVYCVRIAVFDGKIQQGEGETEKVMWVRWDSLRDSHKLIPNLRVIIPMMMNGVQDWVVEDEGPSWNNPTHTIKVTIQADAT